MASPSISDVHVVSDNRKVSEDVTGVIKDVVVCVTNPVAAEDGVLIRKGLVLV